MATYPARGNQLHLPRKTPWYRRLALRARNGDRGAAGRAGCLRNGSAIAVCLGALLVAGCGGGNERQDANERAGNYELEVTDARFPSNQKLAKKSNLVIVVRNTGSATAPNVAVTVDGLSERKPDPDLADPTRPTFVINGRPVEVGGVPDTKEDAPPGCDTAYVNTWACGPLKAGDSKRFRFSVTAVKAGPYDIAYEVAAGLDGKAKAVPASGTELSGTFRGEIRDNPPETRVADDGHTIVEGTR
jgi:hypothetical protein